jgi:hypothetical protein
VVEVCDRVPAGVPVEDSLDQLSAALAERILEAKPRAANQALD